MSSDKLYKIKGLTFSYGRNTVIRGLDMEIEEGGVTTLIGANGCGKTTLFNLMTKNLKPDSGSILLRGRDISSQKLRDYAKSAAIVHQYNSAPPDLSVKKLVEYGRSPYHTLGLSPDPEEDEKLVSFALKITDTEKISGKCISQLSGGQKQRVWIAMALAQNTDILFLDEPTTYLDIKYQLDILRLIRTLNRSYGKTVIMVLHDINQSLAYSDSIVAMKEGRIISHGRPRDVISGELIKEVYGTELKIRSVDGDPFVIPV